MRPRPFTFLALVALGTLVGHQLAYGLVASHDAIGHGYLGAVAALVVPLGFLAMGVVGLRLSGAGVERIGPWLATVASTQIAVFVLQETLEAAGSGHGAGSVVSQPVFWVGILLQPLVAWLLVAISRRGVEAVRTIGGGDTPATAAVGVVTAAPVARNVHRPDPAASHRRRRGPPTSLV